jgi:TonB family protein
MALPVWMANLVAYSLQIAILASAGTLLAYLFRLRLPRVMLRYWQILLLACLVLPGLQNWKHPAQFRAFATSEPVFYITPSTTLALNPKHPFLTTPELIGLVLGAGVCLRLIWLALGFLRLRLFLRNSQPLTSAIPVDQNLFSRIGARARFFISNEIDSPATVGIFSPMVILPGSFPGMSEPCREAIVCHELLHVRRRDWALIVVEEIIRSVYWFHPAVWWLLGRIHLAREQSVDREVVRLTGSRQPYLDSLLEIARSRGRPKAVPALLFLRERHLVQRVALLIKEVSMNRLRLAVSLTGIAVLLTGTVRVASGWFPLTGAPAPTTNQEVAQPLKAPIKVGGNVQESKLIHKVEPIYPELALKARVSGKVVLVITVNEGGFVSDVKVASGHPLLDDAAVAAVRQWQYSPTLLNGQPVPVTASVMVTFQGNTVTTGVPSPSEAFSGFPSPPGREPRINGAVNVFQTDGLGGSSVFRATPIDEKGQPFDKEQFHSPQLSLNKERLHTLAAAGWPAQVGKTSPIAYSFIISEVSEIKNVTRIAGPDIPEVETELARTRVVSPGLRGSAPVSTWCVVEIRLQGMVGGVTGGVVPGLVIGVPGGVRGGTDGAVGKKP